MKLNARKMLLVCVAVSSFGVMPALAGGALGPGVILPMRERAEVIDRWLGVRFERVVPELMREQGIDMWLLIGREYHEDPVLKTMLPAKWLNARRTTMLVFFDPGPGSQVEQLAVSRYAVGDYFASAWNPEEQPDQWARLAEIIEEREPSKIAVNVSPTYAHADGISHSQHTALMRALSDRFRERIVSGEELAIGWLEHRTPEELEVYSSICRIAHEIIGEALSSKVIQPGVTTTDDLKWWCRERIRELKLTTWFHPLVSVQRREAQAGFLEMISGGEEVIRRGDLIHIDLGISYLRLHTDTQQMAYVLLPGETEPPAGIRAAFRVGNEMQDLFTERFAEERTGNEVLLDALGEAERRGIDAMVYTHPLGYHGHAAGPSIGRWDSQGGVPVRGDRTINESTAYAIELSVSVPIPEWDDQAVRIMLEEDAVFVDGAVRYLDGRQTELHIIE